MASSAEDDYNCPVCQDIFKTPVLLSCSHSFCQECLQQFWRIKKTQECPVCKTHSGRNPPVNLALKNLCESFLKERNKRRSSGSEEICSLHSKRLRLFCLEDKQPVCLVCRDSKQHDNHKFKPISEVALSHEEELNTALKSLQEKLEDNENMKAEFEKTAQHIKEFPVSMKRVQISQPDPQMPSGALIHEPRYLGNLPFRVWKKMQDIVQYTPVILDPNTAHPKLELSDDLTRATIRVSKYLGFIEDPKTAESCLDLSDDRTSVTFRGKQPVPDYPERFDRCLCVLGSEGFNSGKHRWDVEVKKCEFWTLGVTTASNQRKGWDFFNSNVLSVYKYQYKQSGSSFRVNEDLDRVRVDLDYDRGTVSFSDPVNNEHLHTFKTTFTHTLYPFFGFYESFFTGSVSSLKILPSSSQ